MSNTENRAHYGASFKAWAVKQLGAQPTDAQLGQAHGLGCRPGKQALAIAMSLRDAGVTGGQIIMACGAPQLNKMRGFIDDAYLKRVAVSKTAEGHTVYKNVVTPKGLKRIEATAKRAADLEAAGKAGDTPKVTEAKVNAKPRKPKASVTPVDVTETPAAVAAEAAHENGATHA